MKRDTRALLSYQQILHEQVIDENGPGTVLRDFETLLEFIGPEGVNVIGKYDLLPIRLLPQLNEQLVHPIEIDLTHPRQNSYPHISGLYLLLRAIGIADIKGAGREQILVLDEAILQSWQGLNPTERYFTLLEAWLVRGSPKILGRRDDMFNSVILNWIEFFRRIPDQGLKIAGDKDQKNNITWNPGLYTVALLELFGLISVQHGRPEKGKGWQITMVHRTPFGDALLQLLLNQEETLFLIDGDNVTFRGLQPIVQPFFPEWSNNLTAPGFEFKDGVHIFKVSLGRVWRHIAISGKMTLDRLSDSILEAFDFDSDHLYCFTYKGRFGTPVNVYHPYVEDEPPWANEVSIGNLPLSPGMSMTYLYDFGDNWKFKVELERIDPVDPKIRGERMGSNLEGENGVKPRM